MDPIADLLTRIRNAGMVKQESVDAPFSKIKLKIAEILMQRGFILELKKMKRGDKKFLRIFLKYEESKPRISGLRRISSPGQRIYKKSSDLKRVRAGFGFSIVSTSKGIITGDEARKKRLGGEVLCEIW